MNAEKPALVRVDYCKPFNKRSAAGFYWWGESRTRGGPFDSLTACLEDAKATLEGRPLEATIDPAAMLLDHIQAQVPNCPMPDAWGYGHVNSLVWPAVVLTSDKAVVMVEAYGNGHPDEALHVITREYEEPDGQETRAPLRVENIPVAVFEQLRKLAAQ